MWFRTTKLPGRYATRFVLPVLSVGAVLVVGGVLVWQGMTAHGNPNPLAQGISSASAIMNTGILVFREGLEAILVLMAVTASLVRAGDGFWKPVAFGAGISFLASVATWFIVVGIISEINAPELDVQAWTGLLAIVVLLIVMNWFFHKVYWTGWIQYHTQRRRRITQQSGRSRPAMFRGLFLLGFTCVYREGFEVVLFLQSVRLRAGAHVVYVGVSIGMVLTLLVAFLTFVAHYRLPYRKMLVLTGVLLGCVLLVMVGESVQEMQQAGWIPVTLLKVNIPDWIGTWFAVFPNVQSLSSQVLAAFLVLGSYVVARLYRSGANPVGHSAIGKT